MSLANETALWEYFKSNSDLSEIGIAALLGNFEAESNIESCRLQGDFSSSRINSVRYAEQFDLGKKTASELSVDGRGWGLAQWTYSTRKKGLLDFCREKGTSCGDLLSQGEYCLRELTGEEPYRSKVVPVLKCATDIRTASDAVLKIYENPADQSQRVRTEGYPEESGQAD